MLSVEDAEPGSLTHSYGFYFASVHASIPRTPPENILLLRDSQLAARLSKDSG